MLGYREASKLCFTGYSGSDRGGATCGLWLGPIVMTSKGQLCRSYSSPTSRTGAPHPAQSSVGAPSSLSSDISILLPLQPTASPYRVSSLPESRCPGGWVCIPPSGPPWLWSPSSCGASAHSTQLALEGRAFVFSRVLVSQLGFLYFWSPAW